MRLDVPVSDCRNQRMCWLGKRDSTAGHRITPLDSEITPALVEDDSDRHIDLFSSVGRPRRQHVPEPTYTNGRWLVEEALPDYDLGLIQCTLRIDVCVACWVRLYNEWVDVAREEVATLEAYYSYLDRMEG